MTHAARLAPRSAQQAPCTSTPNPPVACAVAGYVCERAADGVGVGNGLVVVGIGHRRQSIIHQLLHRLALQEVPLYHPQHAAWLHGYGCRGLQETPHTHMRTHRQPHQQDSRAATVASYMKRARLNTSPGWVLCKVLHHVRTLCVTASACSPCSQQQQRLLEALHHTLLPW